LLLKLIVRGLLNSWLWDYLLKYRFWSLNNLFRFFRGFALFFCFSLNNLWNWDWLLYDWLRYYLLFYSLFFRRFLWLSLLFFWNDLFNYRLLYFGSFGIFFRFFDFDNRLWNLLLYYINLNFNFLLFFILLNRFLLFRFRLFFNGFWLCFCSFFIIRFFNLLLRWSSCFYLFFYFFFCLFFYFNFFILFDWFYFLRFSLIFDWFSFLLFLWFNRILFYNFFCFSIWFFRNNLLFLYFLNYRLYFFTFYCFSLSVLWFSLRLCNYLCILCFLCRGRCWWYFNLTTT